MLLARELCATPYVRCYKMVGERRGEMEGKKIEDGAKQGSKTRGIETDGETKNGRTGKV